MLAQKRTQVEDLFHELADLSNEARTAYFREHAIEVETKEELEALLAFDSSTTTLLDMSIAEVAELTFARIAHGAPLCGPYKLREPIGRGGMGIVYRADRVDAEVGQHVAIKLLRFGANDLQTRRRFLAERQILARLSHPNVARLIDAGHREDGQPYLVMEHVEGQPIDQYTAELGIRQTVKLFLKVCAAVAYLHRNLVVHRDLKPANILVSTDGEPKVLDFGIAKILDAACDFTQTSMRMLTPEYASPEQVMGDPITTASDVYSLGAVLYKLLTGSSPHQAEGVGFARSVTVIREGRIKRPSFLLPAVSADLECIVMKALRPEPQERYATVEQFAEDLENFIHSRPIRARKGDAWYRTRKFFGRHWIALAAATVALGGLTFGMLPLQRLSTCPDTRAFSGRATASEILSSEAGRFGPQADPAPSTVGE